MRIELCILLVARRQPDDAVPADRKRREWDALLATLLAKLTGRKNVIHVHIGWTEEMARFTAWAARSGTSGMLAISQFVARTMTGCGIPADRLARIWEPYVTYKAGGTGLGLAIARQTVLAHQGEVSALKGVTGVNGLVMTH